MYLLTSSTDNIRLRNKLLIIDDMFPPNPENSEISCNWKAFE